MNPSTQREPVSLAQAVLENQKGQRQVSVTLAQRVLELEEQLEARDNALRTIDRLLTTVEDDQVPRGEVCKLEARDVARMALGLHPDKTSNPAEKSDG